VASTYLSLHYHLVFSTKNHEPLITPTWRPRLHEYLGGTVNGLGGISQIVGGVADHVHLLVGLKANHCLADIVRELKKGFFGLGARANWTVVLRLPEGLCGIYSECERSRSCT
jgi:REP element-mobilizing transposase RayT